MKNKIIICVTSAIIIGVTVFIFEYISNASTIPTNSTQFESAKTITTDSPTNLFITQKMPVASTTIGSDSSALVDPSTQGSIPGSYAYLFEGNRETNTSNIVGYFAHGAFAWYVPDWLVTNWEMKPFRAEGMIFSPKVRATPAAGQQEEFSDIEFDVSTSTELNNAYNLYLTMLGSIPKDEIIINEVLLNKSTADMISIQMENSTRIYHITAYTRDFKHISDLYFMDGNGKTLDLRFETKTDIFSQFSDKIRDMVEGIGELKSPQG